MIENARGEQLDYYAKIAREKGYGQETIEMGYMLSMTTISIEKFGNKVKALEEIIEICKKNDDGKQFIGDILKLLDIGDV